MINFPTKNPVLQQIADHYAHANALNLLNEFFANKLTINDDAQALALCRQFQQLIDIAMADKEQPDALSEIKDIENQLFSLFNLMYHAILNLGYEAQWQQAADDARNAQDN